MVDCGVSTINTIRCTICHRNIDERNEVYILRGWPFCTKSCIVALKKKGIKIAVN
jgi:endogenous inhibitor of DNA gyrase (YacG/DUF329 family)